MMSTILIVHIHVRMYVHIMHAIYSNWRSLLHGHKLAIAENLAAWRSALQPPN